MDDDYTGRLLQRALRTFQDRSIATVTQRTRAIIGPAADALPEDAQAALDKLSSGDDAQPSPQQLAALELAIRLMRPSFTSKQGELPELEDDVAPIFPHWDSFRIAVKPFLYTIGRIDLASGRSIGTGFLVRRNLLATNKHVLDELSAGTRRLQKGQARVRFREEYGAPTEAPVDIVNVVAVHPVLDMALLALEDGMFGARQPMNLETAAVAPGNAVVAIGYPFDDKVRNPLFVSALFGNRFGVKRASPGEVIGTNENSLFHDCSTLGGNSGSPIISMQSAGVVGIHHDGLFTYRNEAVNGKSLSDFVASSP